MSEGNAKKLVISKTQYELLNRRLGSLKQCDINHLIDEATDRVIRELCLKNLKVENYIHKYKSIFAVRVINAVKNDSLKNMVVVDGNAGFQNDAIIFKDGDRMSDNDFRVLTDKIAKCENISDKVYLIKSHVHSLQDFIDLLSADCLFESEFMDIFDSLSDMELSALGKVVFFEEIRTGFLDLSSYTLQEKYTDVEWQTNYIRFLQGLSKDRKGSIEKLL